MHDIEFRADACLSNNIQPTKVALRGTPVHLLLQGCQPLSPLLSRFRIEDLVQQGILLKVYLKPLGQESAKGVQLNCADQGVNYEGVAMPKLDFGLSYCTILLQRRHTLTDESNAVLKTR